MKISSREFNKLAEWVSRYQFDVTKIENGIIHVFEDDGEGQIKRKYDIREILLSPNQENITPSPTEEDDNNK